MRVLGLDLGARRIGVALSDPTGTVASPLVVLTRVAPEADHRAVAEIVAEHEVELVVVGLPVSLSGREGPAAVSAREEVAALAPLLAVPIELLDERFTTVTAGRALRAGGVRARDQRQVIDKVAAAVMLQAWLDRRHAQARPAR